MPTLPTTDTEPDDPNKDADTRRKDWQTWLLLGSVFLACLMLFLLRASDSLVEIERSFDRLIPATRVIEWPLNPHDMPHAELAQKEFSQHGERAILVLEQRLDSLLSRRNSLGWMLRARLPLGDGAYDWWTTDVAKCALALEALGARSDRFATKLATNVFRSSPHAFKAPFAGALLAYAGPKGEQLLLDGLTNSHPRIRASCVDGLRHSLFRKATAPNRSLPIDVEGRAWMSATMEDGSAKWRTLVWKSWADESGWMFSTNGVWLAANLVVEMQDPSIMRRLEATAALSSILRTNASGFELVRSNYISTCLGRIADADSLERGLAADALADAAASEPRVLKALEATLSDSSRLVREHATNALRKLGRLER